MLALVARGGKAHIDRARPEPEARAGESRIAVRLAGVCATDLEILRGYMGFEGIPGHEFVGIAIDGPLAGKRVVGEINAACRQCERCARGLDRHCAHRTVLGILGRDGAFAQMLRLPSCNLLEVPKAVSDEAAVFVEPLAAAFAILEQVPILRGTRVAVLGDGRLGILCTWALAASGARVTAMGRHRMKLDLAGKPVPDAFPTERILLRDISTERALDGGTILERCGGPFPVVVDATGSPLGLKSALELVEPRGTIVLKTTTREAPPESLARIVIDEIRVVGSRCGRFAPALDALARGQLDPTGLIHGRLPLEQGVEALDRAGQPGTLKVLLEMPRT
ncbi:MAG: alcohol dehydrogenase catalytic domain-containing protein [Planctomycetes bacterium]|nr:alcohol dehydrogenase catalytic domain-containing protein [Planctomycetota bacterium]